MSIVITDEFLQAAHIAEADLKLEIAIMLFQQRKITLGTASQFAEMDQLEFQRLLGGRKISNSDIETLRQDLRILEASGSSQVPTQLPQAEILKRIEQRRTFSPAQCQLPDTLTLLQEDRTR